MLTRVVTGTLAAAVALAAILWREPWGISILLIATFVAGVLELRRIISPTPYDLLGAALLLGLMAFPVPLPGTSESVQVGLMWLVGCISLIVRNPNNPLQVSGLSFWIASGLTVALFLHYATSIGDGSAFRPNLLLLALVPLWVGDSLAYFVGKAIGKHKLAPSISPNKTWEGAVANLVGCLAAAYAIGLWLEVPLPASIAVGLTTGILGQIGDLLQSRLKRLAEVKDSGSILPGHGGVLDRLDSFLFSSYPSLLALYLLAPGLFHVKQLPW